MLGLAASICLPQETRGSITGTVYDPAKAVVPGATVVVTNTDTGLSTRITTNERGYFEANLLLPGNYSVAATATGFKRFTRTGLVLNVAGRLDIPVELQLGQPAETVEVSAEAPLLDTTTASGGRVVDNQQIMQLPFSDLNPFVLAGLAAGMQWTGRPDYRRPFDNGGTSSFNTMGGVGRNEYTIDGSSNMNGTEVAYVPPADAVEEFKLETSPFDASYGHTSGATINVMTKSGTNAFHGTVYDQMWQKRWNATQHFNRLAWEANVASGKISPDAPKNPSGRQNYYGAGLGGPVRIPKIFDGRDKLFFYFMYSGIMKDENEPGDSANRTVPKMAWRTGDFSDMLAIDASRYQVYDPRSARLDGSRVVRVPFPGNRGIPVLNPMYKAYEPLYPKPNDVPGLVSREGVSNFLAVGMPKNERFKSAINRVDYNINSNHRVYGRWYWNRRLGDEYDWAYETKRGLQSNGITRVNKGVGADYVWSPNSTNILNISANWGRFSSGNAGERIKVAQEYKPSDVGLPAYMDQKAGEFHKLPGLDFDSIADIDSGFKMVDNRATTGQARVQWMRIQGNHSWKFGYDERRYWSTRSGRGNTSGNFTWRNNYVRAADNTNTAANHALDWAAFMMGVPTGISIDTNDTAYWSTRYRSFYAHDDWRITNRLRVNLGLRYEREGGATERFNRGIAGGWDFDQKFVFSDAVEAAYAANPTPELSRILVRGAGSYLGTRYRTYTDGTHTLQPRAGLVYQLDSKTVLRGGYGWYFDSFNVLRDRPSQNGYSQSTGTVITTDNALSFCCGVGAAANLSATRTLLHDPFPDRGASGRFDQPYGNTLGMNIFAGRGFTLPPRDFVPAFQQRWRIGIQREITKDIVVDVSYNGSLSRVSVDQRIDYLPAQYWKTGMKRDQAWDDYLNANITNPFNIRNLAFLQSQDPRLYNYLSTQGFFTATTIRRHQLLRQYPNLNDSSGLRPGVDYKQVRGTNRYHDMQIQAEKRFSRGFNMSLMYTWASGWEADNYYNQFDPAPLVYRPQDALRPHRLAWTTIWEMPFGKGRRWVTSGPAAYVIGGWQLSWIYQFQNGAPTNWDTNRFFYGDIDKIGELFKQQETHSKDIHMWFDPNIRYLGAGDVPQGFVGFEGRSNMQPGSYHVRMFPYRLADLRSDGIRTWDIKILRKFTITERMSFSFAVDLLNATNHTNFGGPNVDPTNTNFGRVTSTNGYARVIQLNGRLQF
jgi:hypothetical protein